VNQVIPATGCSRMEGAEICEEFRHSAYFTEDWAPCINVSVNDSMFQTMNWTVIRAASANYSCTEYYFNRFVSFPPSMIYSVIIPFVCFLGIVGNALNILVKTRAKLLSGMDTLERSATYGLIALALSDLLFCLLVFPNAMVTEQAAMVLATHSHVLYYRLYSQGAVNTFTMVSSWLIVIIAINRLVVVVYPLHARVLISSVKTAVGILAITVLGALVTTPFYLVRVAHRCLSPDGTDMLEARARYDPASAQWQWLLKYAIYNWPVLSHFIPFVVLVVCNVVIIFTLRRASIIRSATTQKAKNGSRKVTLTLVTIVFLYCLLVFPGEVLKFLDHDEMDESTLVLQGVLNVLQSVNFAFNFVLYCLVNPTFRTTTKALLMCRLAEVRQHGHRSTTRMTELRTKSTKHDTL
jgi:hypothetical protein